MTTGRNAHDARLTDETASGGLFDSFTLKGFVEAYFASHGRANGSGATNHHHDVYKLYLDERAIRNRLKKLPPPIDALVEKAVTEFGGILPRSLYERIDAPAGKWDAEAWRTALESHFLGTVRDLALTPFGIQTNEEALVLFHEIVVARLKDVATEKPASVQHELVMGVDLVSDLARFLSFLEEEQVRFTVQGELFKTSEKRLVDQFVPGIDPALKEPAPHEVLDFIHRFCIAERLVHRTGERTYGVSDVGHSWEARPVVEKQQDLLQFAVEDRSLPGEIFHQVRLRRSCLRFLKRLEPERWYDAMFLPFVARNSYVATLDRATVEPFLTARTAASGASTEDLQQLGWNLLVWIRRRLALLGIVDVGLDSVSRPVAIRLSRLGAQLLGVLPAAGFNAGHSHLVVNPNFEIVLLPEGDEFEIVHALDRFCVRVRHEVLYHYVLDEESLRRGLRDGLKVSQIIDWLGRFTRSPLPQNVVYSLHEWAERAGVVWQEGLLLRTRATDSLDRLAAEPRVAKHVEARQGPDALLLKKGLSSSDLAEAARALGLVLDRASEST